MADVVVPDALLNELVAEFGDDADSVVARALSSEITRHRIAEAVRAGGDPVAAVASALSADPEFVVSVDTLSAEGAPGTPGGDPLGDRLRRWG